MSTLIIVMTTTMTSMTTSMSTLLRTGLHGHCGEVDVDGTAFVSGAPPLFDEYDSLYNSSFAHLFLLTAFRSELKEYSCNLRLSRSLNHFR